MAKKRMAHRQWAEIEDNTIREKYPLLGAVGWELLGQRSYSPETELRTLW